MANISRSRLAKGYVSLIGKYPLTRLNIVLAHYILRNKMTNELDLLLSDINQEIARQKGMITADVVSAFELSDQIKRDLKSLIVKETGASKVHLETRIDKTILGGLIARLPGSELDFSLATKLQELRT